MSNVDRTRAHAAVIAVSAVAAAQQQPEGWRFTPVGPGKDTHGTLGPDQREGRGWPESQFSTAVNTVQKHNKQFSLEISQPTGREERRGGAKQS